MRDNQELLAAYGNTTFYADTPVSRIAIRIGEVNPALDRLLMTHKVTQWAYITAHNPLSQRLTDAENESRQQELKKELRVPGYHSYPGEGVGDDKTWPAESSFLVLGITRPAAIEVARRFEQAAIVCGCMGQAPVLVACRNSA